ncbi:Lon protease-like protein, mitochondrial [Bombardia bombarda]|uniref:Lon protease homolog, mitochondrial n=1 Tax=Bombardia bombarda TaxID=252184 RepID=A0AA39XAD8_9PEZI|nr:Lon protease-like protein, mitochondrial [Bombardia bombarda]
MLPRQLPRQRLPRLLAPNSLTRCSVGRRNLTLCLARASVLPPTTTRHSAPQLHAHSFSRNGCSPLLSNFSTNAALGKQKGQGFFDALVEPLSEEEVKANQKKKEAEETDVKEAKSSSSDSPSDANGKGAPESPDGKGSAAGGGASSGSGSDGSGDGGKRGRKPSDKALTKPVVPDVYPQVMALPIAKRPLFPGYYKAITIRDPNVAAAVTEMIKRGQPYVGAFLFKDENADGDVILNKNDVYDVGVFAQITSAFPMKDATGDGTSLTAILYPHQPIPKATEEVPPKGDVVASFEESAVAPKPDPNQKPYDPTSFLKKYPVTLVNVENLTEEPYDAKSPIIRALTNEIVNVFKEVASMNSLFRDQIATFSMSQSTGNVMNEPAKLADFAAAVASGEFEELQEVLSTLNVERRMHKALTLLKKELINAQLQSKITKDVEKNITKRQRDYWLGEQVKAIQKELGVSSDGRDKLVEKFRERANKLAMPEAVRKVFNDELNKLAHLEPTASEFNVTRNYLDWLTQIPWGQKSAENFGIQNARAVLDEDHYGLKDVKDRILEFIAVGKLRGTVEGKILCFVGPPGVGKTSIGKSIARALNRKYYRFSVGGLTDVAEIKGHRRTYVGALPGRVIQALKKCKTENPLILIDEIDKIGRGYQGDPSSALLELLDPEQNSSFLDHYLDVPVDLSKVLFVCTANITHTIPQPLLDRMEVISLSGYVADEKMAIAEKYLAPQAQDLAGLKNVDVNLSKEALEELIKSYCRESGVRNLKKQIEKVYRKSALKIVQDLGEEVLPESEALTEEGKAALEESEKQKAALEELDKQSESGESTTTTESEEATEKETAEKPRVPLKVPDSVHVVINKDNLKDYVGPPVYISDRLYDVTPPGVTMGLAVTSMGGSVLYVESIVQSPLRESNQPSLQITGNLKQVMKESSTIAYSFAKSVMAKQFPNNQFLEKAKIHVHVPDGAVPKDGPSAGITMTTSLLSLALDSPIDPTIAMTGELTLTGKVLRIGGLREKTVAARRAGCKTVIFPEDNLSDWLELPENIKEGVEGRPARWYSDVFDLIFPNLDHEKANKSRIIQDGTAKSKDSEVEKAEDSD